jgi:hypothetical protein
MITKYINEKTTVSREFREDTVVRLRASSGYAIDGSSVKILLPDSEETKEITRAQYATVAIILDQFMLERGMPKEKGMEWIRWLRGIRKQGTVSMLRGNKTADVALEWGYANPGEEDILIRRVKDMMSYARDYGEEKLKDIDYNRVCGFFNEDIGPEDLLPELPAARRIGDTICKAIDAGQYSFELYEIFGITD